MATERDILIKRKDPATGEFIVTEVERPEINRRDLRPIPYGSVVRVKVFKNSNQAALFEYSVTKPIDEGMEICCVAKFKFKESTIDETPSNDNTVIVCEDTEIYKQVYGSDEPVFDHIERPRNVVVKKIAQYSLGDSCRVEYSINNTLVDSMDYTVEVSPREGMALNASGSVDFIELPVIITED